MIIADLELKDRFATRFATRLATGAITDGGHIAGMPGGRTRPPAPGQASGMPGGRTRPGQLQLLYIEIKVS